VRPDRHAWKEGKGERPKKPFRRKNRTSGKAVAREYESMLTCTICKTLSSIFRPRGQVRPRVHRKHCRCVGPCQRVTLHIELGART
jgi:hypothetical protein